MSHNLTPEQLRRKNEEAERVRRDEEDRRLRNMAMGDMLNTGIPGGIDMNITTPL